MRASGIDVRQELALLGMGNLGGLLSVLFLGLLPGINRLF
jgi:hypothetical protein